MYLPQERAAKVALPEAEAQRRVVTQVGGPCAFSGKAGLPPVPLIQGLPFPPAEDPKIQT